MIPIYADTNKGYAAYHQFAEARKLAVTSLFYTIQGEGPFVGVPALFVRLAGCNLGAKVECPWCDADFRFDNAKALSISEMVDQARVLLDYKEEDAETRSRKGLLVWTGGEPLLQWETLIPTMLQLSQDAGIVCHQYETNGVLLTREHLEAAVELSLFMDADIKFVISPKVIGGKYRPLPEFLREDVFDDLLTLKYVVSADPSSPYHTLPPLEEFRNLDVLVSGQTEYGPNDTLAQPGRPVCLFDLSRDALKQTAANYAYAAQLALKHGLRTSYQTHLLAAVE